MEVNAGAAARRDAREQAGERRRGRAAWMALWLLGIAGFAALHAMHLRADFPNHSPWMFDWAKYTDEGWYGNAAVRAHLFGNWYMVGDFNPAVVVPVWPLLEWVVFCFTGVTIEAARALAMAVFFVNLALSYALLRARGDGQSRAGASGEEHAARQGSEQGSEQGSRTGPRTGSRTGSRWAALLAVTLLVTSPFLYCFSRLAILEPLMTAWVLAALNLAVRLPKMRGPNMRGEGTRWPLVGAAGVGVLAVLAALTKTTAIFLLPALAWAMAAPLWKTRRLAIACVAAAGAAFAAGCGLWMAVIIRLHLPADFRYYFFVNNYPRPAEWYWPAVSLWWSAHGLLWADKVLAPLAGVIVPAALFLRGERGRRLLFDPVFGASVLGVAGMVLFMTYQNHPQPRYFAPAAFFVVFVVARGIEALELVGLREESSNGKNLSATVPQGLKPLLERGAFSARVNSCPDTTPMSLTSSAETVAARALRAGAGANLPRGWGDRWSWAALAVTLLAICLNGAQTLRYATHPTYTFINAAANLTSYIDTHPNGKRLLVSISGDEITLLTHLPSLCDDFGTTDLPEKIGEYQPGWYAAWNDLAPGTLEDLHTHFSVEQVAAFPALDDPERHVLVLFKLHPLPNGQVRLINGDNLQQPLPEDKINIPLE